MKETVGLLTCDVCPHQEIIRGAFGPDSPWVPEGWSIITKKHCNCPDCQIIVTKHTCPSCVRKTPPCKSCRGRRDNKGKLTKSPIKSTCSHCGEASTVQREICKWLFQEMKKTSKKKKST